LSAGFVNCIVEVRLMTLRSATGQIGKNFILDTISKVGVLFFITQILEGQYGDAVSQDRSSDLGKISCGRRRCSMKKGRKTDSQGGLRTRARPLTARISANAAQ